jgi:chemotaxis protein MotA
LVVLISVLGSFAAMGGDVRLLMQPFEITIILGGSLGAYIVAQPWPVLKRTPRDIVNAMRGAKQKPGDYLELMACLYAIMRKLKREGGVNSAGAAALESDLNDPYRSRLFSEYPGVLASPRAVTFITDFMKLLMRGNIDAHEMEELLEEELETLRADFMRVPNALHTVAEGMPALGIVAAVMGVIKTMMHIDEPPEVIGTMIASALVGTFSGVLFSYGFFGPLGQAVGNMYAQRLKYFESIKVAILATYKGNPPEAAVEFARKILFSESRPTFEQVENRVEPA